MQNGNNISRSNSNANQHQQGSNIGFPFNLFKNKQFEDMVKWGSVILGVFFVFWILPGVLVASLVDYFKYLTIGQTWGISLIVSIFLFFWLKSEGSSWANALRSHIVFSIMAGFIILLGYMFMQYPMPVRSLYKMFDSQNDVPIFYKSSPGEIKQFRSMHSTADITDENIVGEWKTKDANIVFQNNDQLRFEWKNSKKVSIGFWKLREGILFIMNNEEMNAYWITEFNESEFKYKSILNDVEYLAKK